MKDFFHQNVVLSMGFEISYNRNPKLTAQIMKFDVGGPNIVKIY